MAKTGAQVVFHGAFGTKKRARDKERRTPGAWIVPRTIRGKRRYLVLSRKGGKTRRNMKFLVNTPAARRGTKGGRKMAKRKAPPRYPKGHPKAGKFMSKRAIAARRSKRKSTRRNPGRTTRKNPVRRKRRASSAARKRRPTRRNPPRRKVDIVGSLVDGSVEAVQILVGKAAARSIPNLARLPVEGNVGLAIQAAAALASGYVAGMFLSENAARAIMAGGLTAPIETLIVSYNVPWLSQALSPTSGANNLSAYAYRGRIGSGMSGYVKRRPAPVVMARGMSGYVSSHDRGLEDYGE